MMTFAGLEAQPRGKTTRGPKKHNPGECGWIRG